MLTTGEFEKAAKIYQQLQALNQNDVNSMVGYVKALIVLGNISDAAKILTR